MNIQIGVDDTDHIAFFCDQCKNVMKVTKAETKKVMVNSKTGQHDKCTWIHCKCTTCGNAGWRKFYWTVEDGGYCTHKTDDEVA